MYTNKDVYKEQVIKGQLYSEPFTPLVERITKEAPELVQGLNNLSKTIGQKDFDKYINSLISLRKNENMLLVITRKAMYKSVIEREFLPMIKDVFNVRRVQVINQG